MKTLCWFGMKFEVLDRIYDYKTKFSLHETRLTCIRRYCDNMGISLQILSEELIFRYFFEDRVKVKLKIICPEDDMKEFEHFFKKIISIGEKR